jgi:hypothetical protein
VDRAEPAPEGIVVDTQIELTDAFLVQGGHRPLDDEAAWRTMRLPFSRVTYAQEHNIVFSPYAKYEVDPGNRAKR